jgi:hypothetical protein
MVSPKKSSDGKERRRAPRRPILASFSVFAVVGAKGPQRLAIADVSEVGLAFEIDRAGGMLPDFPVKKDEKLSLKFYLNQSLSIPLEVVVARIQPVDGGSRIGVELTTARGPAYQAFKAFVSLVDNVEKLTATP